MTRTYKPKRLAYVNRLSAAVKGDESKTWREADEALHATP